jgi:hypothetical protein
MTSEERERLYNLVDNPPPGSKIEAAKRAGVNLHLNVYLLSLTPTQRVERMEYVACILDEQEAACGGLTEPAG